VARGNAFLWLSVPRPDDDAGAARDTLEQFAAQIFDALP
jgi:hypothetical protein